MTTSILPDIETGGASIYRDANGNPTFPDEVQNAYSPPPSYITTCELTALPADCNGRIEAKQVNAIISEMLHLAECWDANGPFDCSIMANLCVAFNTWWSVNRTFVDQVSIVGSGTQADPYRVGVVNCGSY
jgi:hypothetical protein